MSEVREHTALELRLQLQRPLRVHDQVTVTFPEDSFDVSDVTDFDCSSIFNGVGTAYEAVFPD